jgi:hypothetical protein
MKVATEKGNLERKEVLSRYVLRSIQDKRVSCMNEDNSINTLSYVNFLLFLYYDFIIISEICHSCFSN